MANITHHIIENDASLEDWATDQDLDPDKTKSLLNFGAIYKNHERLSEFCDLKQGDYLRLHHTPKRYTPYFPLEIIEETPDFIIANKPPGLPTHETLDNKRENVKAILEDQYQEKLFLPHRLDIVTSGLLIAARKSKFCSLIAKEFEKGSVQKTYQAICLNTDIYKEYPDSLTHYMAPNSRAPKEVSRQAKENWKICELKLSSAKAMNSYVSFMVELITGRTHQIRAQLSHEGFPIIGDSLYGAEIDINGEVIPEKELHQQSTKPIALKCIELSFLDYTFNLNPMNYSENLGQTSLKLQ